MASNELGRFKVVTEKRELLLPTVSAFNRADNEEWYIDTDYDSDEGRVYIGKSDFEDMARTVGWVKNDEYKKLELKYNELKAEHNALRNSINSIRTFLPNVVSVLNGLTVEEIERDNQRDPNQLVLDFESGNGTSSVSDESSSSKGRRRSSATGSDKESHSSFELEFE